MHKLGYEVDEINAAESEASVRAVSLIVKSDAGKRSFKVELAPPEGNVICQRYCQKIWSDI